MSGKVASLGKRKKHALDLAFRDACSIVMHQRLFQRSTSNPAPKRSKSRCYLQLLVKISVGDFLFECDMAWLWAVTTTVNPMTPRLNAASPATMKTVFAPAQAPKLSVQMIFLGVASDLATVFYFYLMIFL